MMAAEPFKSARINNSGEDTSLALPSDNNLRTGHQRVRDQVHSIKRSKSKPSGNGGMSPVSPTGVPNGVKPSVSDPTLAPSFPAVSLPEVRAKGQSVKAQQSKYGQVNRHSSYTISNGSHTTTTKTHTVKSPTTQYQSEGKMGTIKVSQSEKPTVGSGTTTGVDLTLKEAVEYLSHAEENYQQCGATFIHHASFKEEQAKQQVLNLGGIPVLVSLLRSPHPGVSQASAGALRNLVFKHQCNKLEVQHCGGIAKALQLLKETNSTETQKQITGLLWNMSSSDELKEELIATALPALTENVVVPFTCWSDSTNNNNIHPDVFYNATGCLRNLSCGKLKARQAMRDCRGLIDSLMSYIQSCVAEEDPDDKSVENCVCILHNLTYQLESECPQCFQKYRPKTDSESDAQKSPIGCFSPKSAKAQKEFSFDLTQMPEESTSSGVNWLCHPTAMQSYLSLLGLSQKDATLEASCGVLQNLTASKDVGSSAMSQILVQKLGALAHISPLLKSPNPSLQKNAVSLLGNMARTSCLQTTMAKQVLPDLTSLLSLSTREMGNSDDAIASVCGAARTLMLADTELSKKIVTKELVSGLADLSENGSFPKGSKAASLLLYSLWNDKNLQAAVKKMEACMFRHHCGHTHGTKSLVTFFT
ncbi:Plakophilin-1 Band-6 protein [Takifugu flavidus]|uniref:Plakophilin-1 Band-6 protein n=1 Tax=Takifugu flavidus TaxID=433684 RepID=A0A5C6MTM5_9TELE|nr:Plakophilin-1 Band-6 protein [Takifugu flavidus]